MEFLFLSKDEILYLHYQIIEEFGGSHGLRDEGALESALIAAENRAFYEGGNIAICAATYAYHLTQAHAFIDGNKRIAAAVAELFLAINDARMTATNNDILELFLGIGSGKIARDQVEQLFESWVIVTN
jgi:death on curing protein